MAEGSKARLVCCPMCENLIKDLTECGSCGAALQAKKKGPASHGKGVGYVDNYIPPSSINNRWAQWHDHIHLDMNMNRSKSVNSCSRASKVGDYSPKLANLGRSLRLKGVDTAGGIYKRNQLGTINEQQDRFSALYDHNYPDDGPPNYSHGSVYGYHQKPVKSFECLSNVPNGVFDRNPEMDHRAQLLEKLDELKQKLSRSHLSNHNGDSLSPGMHRIRPHNHAFHHHPQQRTYGYSSSQHGDSNFSNTRFLNESCRSGSSFDHFVDSDRVLGQHYLPRAAKLYPHQLNFQDPPVHVWPTNIDSDIDATFGRRCPRRKVVITCRNKQIYHPIANGAPFITCYNCLELLILPRNFRKTVNNDQRLRCGACSAVIVFKTDKKKRLIISGPRNPEQRPDGAGEKSSKHPSSRAIFAHSDNNVIDWRDSSGSSELPFSCDVPSSNRTVSGWRNGNRKKVICDVSQVVQEENAPTEELSFNGYYHNTSSSRDSLEASKLEENQLKLHKGSKSSLVGLIKKSFRDLSRSSDKIKNERLNVLVNGQHVPNFAVRNAEKQAGPIHPGNYWYDSRAGFWGVMDQPCSGIIPPFIEELNYPLPENCAAGNTGVFVNGRELHQRDLDMLARKGLPTTRDKSYIIEASGKVFDQGSGIQLHNLGKLAPTVEKEKRGFGMMQLPGPGVVEWLKSSIENIS